MGKSEKRKKAIQYGILAFLVCVSGIGYSISRGVFSDTAAETEAEIVFGTEWEPDTEAVTGTAAEENCFVYVCGAVQHPGVYELSPGSRIYEAVEAAGGFQEDADELAVNLAERVTDGSQICIPKEGENSTSPEGTAADDLVNLNTATKSQLMTLPGIGEVRAEAILAYRESVGKFSCTEDVMKVSGIKNSLFEQIRMLIKV